ncbi:MAG: hypothetical protein JST82_14095 [Bacteroidetes bacterium]|nr:hypothetical protein [Bacteroidota bacterium]
MNNTLLGIIYTSLSILPVILWLLQWRKKELLWIGVYNILYCLSDMVLMYVIPAGSYDHFAYAADMMLISFGMFMYFASVLRTRKSFVVYAMCYGCMLWFYMSHKMWLRNTIMPEYFVAGYYAILTIATTFFVWQVIVLDKKNTASKPLWFGAAFMFFSVIFLLVESVMYVIPLEAINRKYMMLANDMLNDSFQLVKAVILLRLLTVRK